jgi:hypothetical protein
MGSADTVRVLAISGSLRKASSNSALVSAAVRVAPAGIEVSVYGELADVPPFNRIWTPIRHRLKSSDFERLLRPATRSSFAVLSTRTACPACSRTRWTGSSAAES